MYSSRGAQWNFVFRNFRVVLGGRLGNLFSSMISKMDGGYFPSLSRRGPERACKPVAHRSGSRNASHGVFLAVRMLGGELLRLS